MSEKINLKWVVAHEPLELFLRSARLFADIVAKMSDNRITVDVMTNTEWSEKFGRNKKEYWQSLEKGDGDVDMGQYTTSLIGQTYKNFSIFDMPFLFRDHNHVEKVLTGPIGETMLKHLSVETNYRGLAFTYSGGFRMIVSKNPIKKLEDLKGLTFSCPQSDVIVETYKTIGTTAHKASHFSGDFRRHLDDCPEIDFDGSESTFVRYHTVKDYAPYITNTKHSLFLTTIVIGNNVWEKLSLDDQLLIKEAAQQAADHERDQTIKDSEEFVKNSAKNCAGLYEFSDEDIEKFKKITSKLYEREFANSHFSPNLLKQIMNQ